MKIYPLSYRKLQKRLLNLGFLVLRQKGSHVFFKHPDGRTTIVPNHPGDDIGRGLIRKILRDIDLSVQEFYAEI
ncbi:MAG: type II toxin-antitoxin system HicA family toxin [Candidatus Heimdallarchaeota archaeon]|nr:type II toxin-antitoxin system HicA family toxin [Candidatus Heimdallarchaeota archaeon]